jgi:pimeloyl-ACP methyl ester carboxylesterase
MTLVTLLTALACAAGEPPAAPPAVPDRAFTVPLADGRLEVAALVHALAGAYGLDGTELAPPDIRIDLRGPKGAWILAGARVLLLDTVRFRRDLERGELGVTIDRERSRAVRRKLRGRLARLIGRFAGRDVAERRYEMDLPPGLDRTRPLAVLVHGVESDAAIWDDLREFLAERQPAPQVATFNYPNDEAIERIAPALAERLRALGDQPLVLVGHSMGGLVARALVEDPALDPGTVRKLILIGTPNGGSNLAWFRLALEAADAIRQVDRERTLAGEILRAILDHWEDGLGEAGADLGPGSVFMQRLAACGRNRKVEYHLVLGTRSVLRSEQLDGLRDGLRAGLEKRRAGRLLEPRLGSWAADLDELVDGKGDGAVSIARGRLEGVEPVLVPLDHVGLVRLSGLVGPTGRAADHPVFTRIAGWLEP